MKKNTQGSLIYYTFEHFESTGLVRHAFSTRAGGVSCGGCSTLNLGFARNDSRENVLKNYDIFLKALDINGRNLVFSAQTHTTNVLRVFGEHRGNGFTRQNAFADADGLATDEPQTALVTFYADCVPLFFLDPAKKAIALSHAGWRGTLNKIAAETVALMEREFGSKPQDILAGIGPSIGPCCFETDEPVYSLFECAEHARTHVTKSGEKAHIDLWGVNRDILEAAGILPQNIETVATCTKCNPELFYSHRAQGENRGSLAAIMELA